MRRVGDPRLRVIAHAIRHGQRGEITLMHGIPRGFAVARAGWHAMVAPAAEGAMGH
jgi:hypothetical protein